MSILQFALFPLVSLLLASPPACAQVTTGLDFLNIGVGARASGMGGAFVAVADDASAAYWNPAGLSRVTPQVLFVHNAYIVDMRQEYISAATRIGKWSIAGSFNILDVGSLEKRDDTGALLGEFRPFDLALGFSAAYEVRDGLSLGGTAKGVMSDIDVETATGVLFDVGAIWEMPSYGPVSGLSVGMAVRNIGQSVAFIEEPVDPPMGVRGGLAYRLGLPAANSNVVVSYDVERMQGGEVESFFGGEWYYGEYISGRLGLQAADTQDIATGFGAHYRNFVVDYAFVPFEFDLGSAHRIAVTYLFRR